MQAIDKNQLPAPISYCFLFFIYISTFKIFATLPFEDLHQFITNSAIIILLIYYILNLVLNFSRKKISRLDIFVGFFILVNFFSAFTSHIVFGQPYFYGLMAQRAVLLS